MTIEDPFLRFVHGSAPEIVADIPTPDGLPEPPDDVSMRHVRFRSLTIETPDGPVTNEVHCAIVTPKGLAGPLPGVLAMHGGMGRCELDKAILWAQRGYVCVAPDLPSIANPETVASRGAWVGKGYGAGRMSADPDITGSSLFQGIVAGIQAFKLLQSHASVDPGRLGITGMSWGGYMTTMLSGLLGDQVCAAVSVFGCGFYEDTVFMGELSKMPPVEYERWIAGLDAGRRASGIKAAFLFAAAVNDTFFWPPAITRTYHEIPGEKNVVFAPNCDHDLDYPGGGGMNPAQAADWFAYHMSGRGDPHPRVIDAKRFGGIATFRVESARPITDAFVYYAVGDDEWKLKKWIPVPATQSETGEYTAVLPDDVQPRWWFAFVTDDRPVSVSSLVISGS